MKITSILILPAFALAGCASEIGHHAGGLAATHEAFGDAVRHNIAVQTVNPDGSSEDVSAGAARTAAAVAAYRADEVEKPQAPGTMSIQTGGGSGE